MKNVIVVCVFFLAIIASTMAQENQQWQAKVLLIKGSLLIKAGEAQWNPVKVGDQLKLGDTLKTGAKSYAEIVYGEKVVCKMSENTEFTIKTVTPEKKTIFQSIGKLWFKVQKLVGEKFEVETRFGTAGVRGTIIGSETDPATGTQFVCEEGTIYLRDPKGTESEMGAGNSCGFDTSGNLTPVVPYTGPGFDLLGLLGNDGEDGGKKNEPARDSDEEYFRRVREDIGRWENDFMMDGTNVDFNYIGTRAAMYDLWEIAAMLGLQERQKSDDQAKRSRADELIAKINELNRTVEKCKDLVKAEDLFNRKLLSLYDKMKIYQIEYTSVLASLDGSFQGWIYNMRYNISMGYTISDEDRATARILKSLMNRYEPLLREYHDYQKLLRNAERLNITTMSGRIVMNLDKFNELSTNFYANTFGDAISRFTFLELRNEFTALRQFLDGEGRVMVK